MSLWQKNGGPPSDLPEVDYDAQGLPWTDLANSPDGRVACGWTQAPPLPAHDPWTERVVWNGSSWSVEPLPAPPSSPLRITKIDAARLLTAGQRARLAAKRREVALLTAADYAGPNGLGPTPYNALLIALEDVMVMFELPAEYIELDHPDTGAAFQLYRYLDIIESDAELQRILAGAFPET